MEYYKTEVKTEDDLKMLIVDCIFARVNYFSEEDIINFVISKLKGNLLAFRREIISLLVHDAFKILVLNLINYDNTKGNYIVNDIYSGSEDRELIQLRKHVEEHPELFYKEKRKLGEMIYSDEDLDELIKFTILDRQSSPFKVEDIVDIVTLKLKGSQFEEYGRGLIETIALQLLNFYSDNHPYGLNYHKQLDSYSFDHWYDEFDDPELIYVQEQRDILEEQASNNALVLRKE